MATAKPKNKTYIVDTKDVRGCYYNGYRLKKGDLHTCPADEKVPHYFREIPGAEATTDEAAKNAQAAMSAKEKKESMVNKPGNRNAKAVGNLGKPSGGKPGNRPPQDIPNPVEAGKTEK